MENERKYTPCITDFKARETNHAVLDLDQQG